ncbi:MAG TPA: hypothetical protein VLC93_02250, partial [Myxococcota bacterium]|nr:hypothetical protein [Myxococcota bacterium]
MTFDNRTSHVRGMKWNGLVLASLFCVACGSKNANPGPGDHDLPKSSVHFIGRHDTSNPERVRADWSAT